VAPPAAVEQHQRRVQDQDDAQHDAAPEGDAPRPAARRMRKLGCLGRICPQTSFLSSFVSRRMRSYNCQ